MKEKEVKIGGIQDVYNHVLGSDLLMAGDSAEEFEKFDLLRWFLDNHSRIGEEPITIWADTCYYHGNHAHEEWCISISRIETPWGRFYKVIEEFADYAFYSYDNRFEYKETIFLKD